MLQRCCLLILTCVAASGFQNGGDSLSDASRRADVYAIYSLLLANAPLSHPGDNQVYLVAGTTVPGVPREPCVRPPDEYAAGFAEIMADYDKRKNVAVILQPAFQLDKPYRLLNTEEVKEFIELHRLRPGPRPKPRELFEKSKDLFYLTNVFFNQSRTLALTAIRSYCGQLCGRADWKVFEKAKNGRWEERHWIACSTMF
jgi:hypothetical protein